MKLVYLTLISFFGLCIIACGEDEPNCQTCVEVENCVVCTMTGDSDQSICQSEVDAEIAAGNLAPGTTIADITNLLEPAGYICQDAIQAQVIFCEDNYDSASEYNEAINNYESLGGECTE